MKTAVKQKITPFKVTARPADNLERKVTTYLQNQDQKDRWIDLMKQNNWVILEI